MTAAPASSHAHHGSDRPRPFPYHELTRFAAPLDRCVRCRQVDLVTPISSNAQFGAGRDGEGIGIAPVDRDGVRTSNPLGIRMSTNVVRQLAAACACDEVGQSAIARQ